MVKKYIAPLSVVLRWGHKTTPSWLFGAETQNPIAGAELIGYNIPGGKKSFIYGFYISTPEANVFELRWVSSGNPYKYRILAPGAGMIYLADIIPVNEGLPGDGGSRISINVINPGSGIYHAGIFRGDIDG